MPLAVLSSYVTYNPLAASPTTTLAEGLAVMSSYSCRHLPVVDQSRRVIGVVSDLDLAAALDRQQSRFKAGEFKDVATDKVISQVMTKNVVTLDENATPAQALAAILQNGFHSVPIVAAGELLGIVTSFDFLREIGCGEFPCSRECIADHFTGPAETIDAAASLSDALTRLSDPQVRCLIVVRGEMPLGVVSKNDVHRARLAAAGLMSPINGWPARTELSCIGDAFAGQPLVATPEQTLAEAATIFNERGCRAIAIADGYLKPCGVLRDDDLLLALAQTIA